MAGVEEKARGGGDYDRTEDVSDDQLQIACTEGIGKVHEQVSIFYVVAG